MLDSKPAKRLNSLSIIALALCLLLINLGILFVIHLRYQDDYVAAQEDKIALLENTPSPRIILVGGSNVAFGVDSAMLQESTGYHVVNMGLNGNLGLHYMLSVVQSDLEPGDLVIIMPEYQQFLNDHDNVGPVFVQMLIAGPELMTYISSPEEALSTIQLFPYVYTQAIQSIVRDIQERDCIFCNNDETIYYRTAFNNYGDIISYENVHPVVEVSHLYLNSIGQNPNISKAIHEINRFAEKAASKQASTVMIFPATTSPDNNEITIQTLAVLKDQLDSQLDINMLGEIDDAWYSQALFFDTYYHLTPEGRTLNTTRIIELLEPYIQNHFYN